MTRNSGSYNLSLRLPPPLTDKRANRGGVFGLRLGLQIELELLRRSVSLATILKDSCQFEVRLSRVTSTKYPLML